MPEKHDKSAGAKMLDERRAARPLHGDCPREILLLDRPYVSASQY